jgi:dihydroflavonol-4-reductase
VRRVCHTSTVNVLGFPWPDGAVGTEECSPYAARPRLHSCASAAQVVALADAVHCGRAPRGWWRRIRVGYFDSKLAAQELVNKAVREGLDAVSVLPGTFFGPGDELLGPAQYVLAVLRGALPGVPRGGLPLAHVHDVAVGHILAVEKGARGAAYIVSGQPEDNRRFADMMRIIAEVLREKEPARPIRSELPVVPYAIAWIAAGLAEGWALVSGRAPEVSRQAVRASQRGSFYSSQLAAATLGYRPEKSFREGVAEMYDYLKAHGVLDRSRRQTASRRTP